LKAAVLRGKNEIRIEEVNVPEPGPKDVLIRVRATGICGSDVPRVLGDAAHRYPIVLGHEFAGVVERVGASVTKTKPGDRVVGVPLKPCHGCDDCRSGLYAQCKHYSFVGSRENGSWAEYVVVPEDNALPFDDAISFEEAALVEPSAVALHALRLIGFQGGEHVAILGGGNIGLLTLQWANAFGARTVTVIDIDDERLRTAAALGADCTINASEPDFERRWKELTDGRGFGVVMETAGADATMRLSFELAANRGNVCFVGTPTRDLTFPYKLFELMNRKEFKLTGSWMSYGAPFPGDEWALTLHFLREGRLNFKDIVYRTLPLERVGEAFEWYATAGAVKGKILLVPGGER